VTQNGEHAVVADLRAEGPQRYTVADLFPPEGTLYFTPEDIEHIRLTCIKAGGNSQRVSIGANTLLGLICDWKNLQPGYVEPPTAARQKTS
jgi:hypothetical protein